MDSSTSLKPNDIALILRPTIVDGVYQKHFQVLVSGFGPLTISEDDVNNLIGMATILPHTKMVLLQVLQVRLIEKFGYDHMIVTTDKFRL
jgi:hypothetical protein